MPTITETIHPGAFIVSEPQGFAGRDALSVAVSQTILPATLLGKVGTDHVAFNPAGADGSQTPVGIAIYGVVTNASVKGAVSALVRGPSEYRIADISWPAGATDPQKTTAMGVLRTLNIIGR